MAIVNTAALRLFFSSSNFCFLDNRIEALNIQLDACFAQQLWVFNGMTAVWLKCGRSHYTFRGNCVLCVVTSALHCASFHLPDRLIIRSPQLIILNVNIVVGKVIFPHDNQQMCLGSSAGHVCVSAHTRSGWRQVAEDEGTAMSQGCTCISFV